METGERKLFETSNATTTGISFTNRIFCLPSVIVIPVCRDKFVVSGTNGMPSGKKPSELRLLWFQSLDLM